MNSVSDILNLRLLALGRTVITTLSIGTAAIIIVLSFGAAKILGSVLTRMRERSDHARAPLYIVQKVSTYGLTLFGLLLAMSALGLNLSSLAVFAGAIGVGVGLGLQGIVKEFVSGLVLIFDNELRVGDFIELEAGKARGSVMEIGARATHIRTGDAVDILVPNSKLIDGTIINWTRGDGTRRMHIPFTVAYGVDKAKVRDAVLAAAQAVPFTMPEDELHTTQVWMTGFGDSALNFELVVWPTVDAVKRPGSMQAAYVWAIDDALRSADIEMPFPQRDIRIRGLFNREGDDALRSLDLQNGPLSKTAKVQPAPSSLAEDVSP